MVLDHIEAVGYVENEKDVQTVSDLMDEIRDAVTDYQVSGDARLFPHSSLKKNWSRRKPNRPYITRTSN